MRLHIHWFRTDTGHPSTVVWWLGVCRCGARRAAKIAPAHQPLPTEYRDTAGGGS
jgi:hypothetical protein